MAERKYLKKKMYIYRVDKCPEKFIVVHENTSVSVSYINLLIPG